METLANHSASGSDRVDSRGGSRRLSFSALGEFAPILGLVLISIVFSVLTGLRIFGPINLQSLTNQVLITALVSAGAVFVFGSGAFDMSLGGSLGLTAIIGAEVAMATGSIVWMALACLAVSLLIGLVKGLLAAYVEVPFFIVTIVIGVFLGALGLLVMGKETVLTISTLPAIADMTPINLASLGFVFAAGAFLFNFTKLGKSCKLVGGNERAARQSGIEVRRTKILAFLVSALTIAIAATIILLRTKTASAFTGATAGTDIMVALVLGGMPLSGGPRSKLSAALVGAASITVLNSGLAILGAGPGVIQALRGITFLAVVYVASLSYRTGLLPR